MNRTRTSLLDAFGLRNQRNRIYPTMEGSDGSTLSLDFTTMSSLDSRFTFTRASTTSTFINSSGLVATAGTNIPRFDYDPTTLAPRGLLIEGSVVNIFPYSNAMTGGQYEYGVSNSLTTTFNNTETASPDGSNNSVKVVKASGSQTYTFVRNQITPQVSGVHTGSVWVKKPATNGSRYVGLRITGSGFSPANPDKHLLFDLDTGTVVTGLTGNGYYTNPTIVAYPNGWYRISITSGTMTPGAGTAYLSVCMSTPALDGSEFSTLAAGTCFYMFGPQAEVGSGATSYIPTGSSTAQRAADSCSFALSSFGFSTTGGTFFADWYRKNNDAGTQGGGPWNTDYTTSRWFGVQTNVSSNTVSLFSWSGQTNIANGSTRNKAAATYGAWTGSVVPATFCVNNSAVSSANRDFNPSLATYLTIGAASSGAGSSPAYGVATRDWLNNSIRSIKYWPSILPDATLQSLTA